jgi:hypothetical protein
MVRRNIQGEASRWSRMAPDTLPTTRAWPYCSRIVRDAKFSLP